MYVANQGDDTVSVIDSATNAIVATIVVGDSPLHAVVSPDGTRLYVAMGFDDYVSAISL